jgi:hypothetical protein
MFDIHYRILVVVVFVVYKWETVTEHLQFYVSESVWSVGV